MCTFHVKKNSARLQWYFCALVQGPWASSFIIKSDCQQMVIVLLVKITEAEGSSDLLWSRVVRRPASVCPLDNLHFQILLQNCLIDYDETWNGWSTQGPLQVLLFFGQICPGADPGWGKTQGVPSSKNFFFRPEGYSNKPNA